MSSSSQEKIAQIRKMEQSADEQNIRKIIDILVYDTDPFVREAAADALGNIGNDIAVPALSAVCLNPNAQISSAAKRAMDAIHAKVLKLQEEKRKKLDQSDSDYAPDYSGG
jgi:HEAT repeat protein